MAAYPPIHGNCDQRFQGVRAAFDANFSERGEIGGAVCVMVGGEVVVDLVGGFADEEATQPWQHDSLVNAFSVGKGIATAVVAQLVGEAMLDADKAVSSYWPEFAAAGKQDVTLRQLLSHQAGLPAVRNRMAPGAMLRHDDMAAALAAQEPWWEPGTAHGYHTNTWGFLVNEVVQRVSGHTIGALLRERVAGPLGADVHLGVPASEQDRIAHFHWPGDAPPEEVPPGLRDDATGLALMRHNTYWNPSGISGAGVLNTAAWRSAELPSTNLHATARGIARIYSALAGGGEIEGVRIVDADVLRSFTSEQVVGEDLVLQRSTRFALGFQLTQPERPLGPNPGAFGHFGAGGSLGFADPQSGVAFGYLTNQIGPSWQSKRNRALLDALYRALR